jgi:hypothetical protein
MEMQQYFSMRGADAVHAAQQALAALALTVRREALVMAYRDCFFTLGAVLAARSCLPGFAGPRSLYRSAAIDHHEFVCGA